MRKVGPDGSIQPFSSWAFVTLNALTGWTSTYSLLGDCCHRVMSCSRSLDAATCSLPGVRKMHLILRETRFQTRATRRV